MSIRDYRRKKIFNEAFVDVGYKLNHSVEYSDLIKMWNGDFSSIVEKIPLNKDGMYVALACHYQVDEPWEECAEEPWEVDELVTSLSQLSYVRDFLHSEVEKSTDDNDDSSKLLQICSDMCDVFDKAIKQGGKVYIRYYY